MKLYIIHEITWAFLRKNERTRYGICRINVKDRGTILRKSAKSGVEASGIMVKTVVLVDTRQIVKWQSSSFRSS